MSAATKLRAEDEDASDDEAFDREMSQEDWAKLHAVIDESDAAHARGESVPVEVLFEDLRRARAKR